MMKTELRPHPLPAVTPDERSARLRSTNLKAVAAEAALEVATEAALLAIDRGLSPDVVVAEITREVNRQFPTLTVVSSD